MISLASYIYKRIRTPKKNELSWEEQIKQLAPGSSSDDSDSDSGDDEPQPGPSSGENLLDCFKETGKITSLSGSNGTIDDNYTFSKEAAQNVKLRVGMTVTYMYRMTENDRHVIFVEEAPSESWGEEESLETLKRTQPELFKILEHKSCGSVEMIANGVITLSLNSKKYSAELDDVRLSYTPKIGDVVLIVYNEIRNDNDTRIQILEILPESRSFMNGEIVRCGADFGVIRGGTEDVLFTSDVTKIKLWEGLQVVAEVIPTFVKNMFGQFHSRAVKVFPRETRPQAPQPEPEPSDEMVVVKENDELEKNGIVITSSKELKRTLKAMKEKTSIVVNVRNVGEQQQNVLNVLEKGFQMLRKLRPKMNEAHCLLPGADMDFEFEFTANQFGGHQMNLVFFFENFQICRKVRIEVESDTNDSLPEERRARAPRSRQAIEQMLSRRTNMIPGEKLQAMTNFKHKKLDPFDIPIAMRKIVLQDITREEVEAELQSQFPCKPLDINTYADYFHDLIYLEEIENAVAIKKYDRDRAYFMNEKRDGYLRLMVENVKESRPSLIVGDSLEATQPWIPLEKDEVITAYQGIIHRIEHSRVLLKFNESFHRSYAGEDYRIEFKFSRSSYIKQHNAVKLMGIANRMEFLFPTRILREENPQLDLDLNADENLIMSSGKVLPWTHPTLNIVQKQAIKRVLRGDVRQLPYVIFGPPGTGKTSTLIELIVQIINHVPKSRIIIATPSNSSANLIMEKLIESNQFESYHFLRLIGHNALAKDQVPVELLKYCATIDIGTPGTKTEVHETAESGLRRQLNAKDISMHRIVIGTCGILGNLMQMAIPPKHFSHVIIDEAGQCLESEAMQPIAAVALGTQVILAGDPLQLGPIVMSGLAKYRGFDKSFLTRLFERPLYKPDISRFPESGYHPLLVTKLTYNYRALPSIVGLYSDLFYGGNLKATIKTRGSPEAEILQTVLETGVLTNTSLESETDPYAVFFHGVRGECKQYEESPSWGNDMEATRIGAFVTQLYHTGKVTHSDIGIITPYNLQAKIIRQIFADLKDAPKVGSVEEFQGQERNIILVSTVRSRPKRIKADLQMSLGFVQCPNRTNVAISRAKSLLVIFGNPNLLVTDDHWKEVIQRCVNNGTYIGVDPPSQINVKQQND